MTSLALHVKCIKYISANDYCGKLEPPYTLTAPVRSSRLVKVRGFGDLGGCTACGITMNKRHNRLMKMLNPRRVCRKRKYDRTLDPNLPPICFRATCQGRKA